MGTFVGLLALAVSIAYLFYGFSKPRYYGQSLWRAIGMFIIRSIIATVCLNLSVWTFQYWWSGATTVTATLDGEPLTGALVEIDGKVVGKTPFAETLSYGEHAIRVLPPKDNAYAQEYFSQGTMMLVVGDAIKAPFTSVSAAEITVSATLDGRPFKDSIVVYDGEDVGLTPHHITVSPGKKHYLMVLPPDDQVFAEAYCEWELSVNFTGEIPPCSFTSLPLAFR